LEGLDNVADEVIFGTCLVAIDCEAWRVNAELNPADKVLGCWLRALETTNIVAVAL